MLYFAGRHMEHKHPIALARVFTSSKDPWSPTKAPGSLFFMWLPAYSWVMCLYVIYLHIYVVNILSIFICELCVDEVYFDSDI